MKYVILGLLLSVLPAMVLAVQIDSPRQSDSLHQADTPNKYSEYMHERTALLQSDSALRFDAGLALTPEEETANARIVRLRDSLTADETQHNYFAPALYFYGVKSYMESTPLFKALYRMPKGGIMHIHTSSTASARWVVNAVVVAPHCYVCWKTADPAKKGVIKFFKAGTEPEGFIAAATLNKTVKGFRDSLYALLTFSSANGQDSLDIWKEFEYRFARIGGFVSYAPIFNAYYKAAFDSLVADGVQFVELRAGMSALYDLEHPAGYYTKDTTVARFRQVAESVRREHPSFVLKLIYAGHRRDADDKVLAELAGAYRLRKSNPDLITGYDLVGEEDAGHTSLYFLEEWMKRDSLQQVYGIDMPLFLHDGETVWPDNRNLYDAVTLNSRRIGHGFNLYRFPALQREVKQRDLCIEVSPLSNQILSYIRDLRNHPASMYLNEGIQCTISSDDPGLFGYTGLTYDYWSATMAWKLDLRDLKKLVLNTFTYSTLSNAEREEGLKEFHLRWEKFIKDLNEGIITAANKEELLK